MTAAIIFDMDGVLIDSEPLLLRATNIVLGRRAAALTADQNAVYLGTNQRSYWTDLKKRFALDGEVADLISEREAALAELMDAGLAPAAGAVELVEFLRDRGIRLALATGSGRQLADKVLREIGLSESFEVITTGDEVRNPKPDPEIFLLAAKRLGVKPAEVVVLEDSVGGVRAAQAAGMKVFRVVTDTTRAMDFPPVDGTIDGFGGFDPQSLLTLSERSAP